MSTTVHLRYRDLIVSKLRCTKMWNYVMITVKNCLLLCSLVVIPFLVLAFKAVSDKSITVSCLYIISTWFPRRVNYRIVTLLFHTSSAPSVVLGFSTILFDSWSMCISKIIRTQVLVLLILLWTYHCKLEIKCSMQIARRRNMHHFWFCNRQMNIIHPKSNTK